MSQHWKYNTLLHTPVRPNTENTIILHTPVCPASEKTILHTPVCPDTENTIILHTPMRPDTEKTILHTPVCPDTEKTILHTPVCPDTENTIQNTTTHYMWHQHLIHLHHERHPHLQQLHHKGYQRFTQLHDMGQRCFAQLTWSYSLPTSLRWRVSSSRNTTLVRCWDINRHKDRARSRSSNVSFKRVDDFFMLRTCWKLPPCRHRTGLFHILALGHGSVITQGHLWSMQLLRDMVLALWSKLWGKN